MGILYDSMKKVDLHQQMKRSMILERLTNLGVTQNQIGQSIHELDYDELKTVLVLAEMRQVDIDHPDHKWFR
jgi:hypothetical protein